jgi:hypothetical protein
MFVLEVLRKFKHLEQLVSRLGSQHCGLMIFGPFVSTFSQSIERDIISKGIFKNQEVMLEMVDRLFRNTNQKIPVFKSLTFNGYIDSFVGEGIRWECLGAFFIACGIQCNTMTCDDPGFGFVGHNETDRQSVMHRLLEASNFCAGFCEDAGQLSDLGMWVTLQNCIYASQVLGDAHYLVWRKVGDLATAIFAQGLHQEGKGASNLPFWLNESRRRALGTAYSVDKLLCTFVGRPPRISQRYCTIVPPLDLEFEELTYLGADLDRALSNIGDDGWNRDTNRRMSVYQRCFVRVAILREQVLELSLGPVQENMMEKARYVLP